MTQPDASSWSDLQWRRKLETFGDDGNPALAAGPGGETDGIWQDRPILDVWK